MASATSNYSLPYPLSSDNVNINSDIQALAEAVDSELLDHVGQVSASYNLITASAADIYNILDTKADLAGDTFTGTIYQNLGSLSTASAASLIALSASAATSNADRLNTKVVRRESGSDWQSAQWKIQRETDSVGFEYIGFGGSNIHAIEIGVQESRAALFTFDEIELYKDITSSGSAYFEGPMRVATPTDGMHAATKAYTDSIIGSGGLLTVSSQSASYTLVISDLNSAIEMNSSSSVAFIIPSNASATLSIGFSVDVIQTGSGEVVITPDTGVTLQSKDGNLKLAGQYAAASLYKRATDTWIVIGDLIP